MGRVATADRAKTESEILEFMGEEKVTCNSIAAHVGKHPKTVYGYLRELEGTHGVVRKAGRVCGSGGWVYLWERCSETKPLWGAKFVTDWKRGEHKRDAWDVALFGERRKPEPVVVVDPRQMDLLEGIG